MESQTVADKIESSGIFGGITAWYGMRARPAGLGATPKGQSAIFTNEEALTLFNALKDTNNIRHGVICYPSTLSEKDIKAYELIPLSKQNGIELKFSQPEVKSSLHKALISLISNVIISEHKEYALNILEYHGTECINNAFKQTNIFRLRKSLPEHYKLYFECFQTITSDMVVQCIIDS